MLNEEKLIKAVTQSKVVEEVEALLVESPTLMHALVLYQNKYIHIIELAILNYVLYVRQDLLSSMHGDAQIDTTHHAIVLLFLDKIAATDEASPDFLNVLISECFAKDIEDFLGVYCKSEPFASSKLKVVMQSAIAQRKIIDALVSLSVMQDEGAALDQIKKITAQNDALPANIQHSQIQKILLHAYNKGWMFLVQALKDWGVNPAAVRNNFGDSLLCDAQPPRAIVAMLNDGMDPLWRKDGCQYSAIEDAMSRVVRQEVNSKDRMRAFFSYPMRMDGEITFDAVRENFDSLSVEQLQEWMALMPAEIQPKTYQFALRVFLEQSIELQKKCLRQWSVVLRTALGSNSTAASIAALVERISKIRDRENRTVMVNVLFAAYAKGFELPILVGRLNAISAGRDYTLLTEAIDRGIEASSTVDTKEDQKVRHIKAILNKLLAKGYDPFSSIDLLEYKGTSQNISGTGSFIGPEHQWIARFCPIEIALLRARDSRSVINIAIASVLLLSVNYREDVVFSHSFIEEIGQAPLALKNLLNDLRFCFIYRTSFTGLIKVLHEVYVTSLNRELMKAVQGEVGEGSIKSLRFTRLRMLVDGSFDDLTSDMITELLIAADRSEDADDIFIQLNNLFHVSHQGAAPIKLLDVLLRHDAIEGVHILLRRGCLKFVDENDQSSMLERSLSYAIRNPSNQASRKTAQLLVDSFPVKSVDALEFTPDFKAVVAANPTVAEEILRPAVVVEDASPTPRVVLHARVMEIERLRVAGVAEAARRQAIHAEQEAARLRLAEAQAVVAAEQARLAARPWYTRAVSYVQTKVTQAAQAVGRAVVHVGQTVSVWWNRLTNRNAEPPRAQHSVPDAIQAPVADLPVPIARNLTVPVVADQVAREIPMVPQQEALRNPSILGAFMDRVRGGHDMPVMPPITQNAAHPALQQEIPQHIPVEPNVSDIPVEPNVSDIPVEPNVSDIPVEPNLSDISAVGTKKKKPGKGRQVEVPM